MTATATVTTRLLSGFDDPSFGPADWERVLATGQSDVVFLTWHWQSAWWESFGRGELLLIAAERDGKVVALAPLFTEAGMIYFVGSGGSDYLDFVGDINEPEILDALLAEAKRGVRDFIGFVFYHVPESSETGWRLRQAAGRLGLKAVEEGSLLAPALESGADKQNAAAAANKKSLVRHERGFLRDGQLQVGHLDASEQILPHLEEFFAQHISRWAATAAPSLFNDETQKQFYRRLARMASDAGWLRFTRLEWQGRVIAFHFGFNYRGSFLWYKPAFDFELASRSPGEVLLRQLLLKAMDEGAHTFDFGLGDEAFKSRFATQMNIVRNWGLYNPDAIKK
ncbi:MAG TPA: GNAT family N-acetyltransferase [Verrucomicrobiae bacterium]|nr:GNAT family N-acetyltransferase [Verrucomicrobiae bacterium]